MEGCVYSRLKCGQHRGEERRALAESKCWAGLHQAEAVVAASMLVLECPDNTIHLGPAIKGLLPGIYKVATEAT